MSNQLNDVTLTKERYDKLKHYAEVGEIIMKAVEDDEISAAEIERLLNLYRE